MSERLTRAQAAAEMGVSRQRVHTLIESGQLTEQNGTIDADEVRQARGGMDVDKVQRAEAVKALKGNGEPAAKKPDPIARNFNLARAREQIVKTKQREHKFAIEQGLYVPREIVVQQNTAAGKMLRHRIEGACKALAPQVCVAKDQEEALALLMRTLVDGVLADFCHDLELADAQ